jgi:hypothetical protein
MAERENYHGNVMHRARAAAGEHPNEKCNAEKRKAHEQVVAVLLNDAIEKLRHTCQV